MLKELFFYGFWISLAMVVFSVGMTLILYLIAAIAAGVGWVVSKITGKDF
jgi:hypothetical protein